MRLLCPRCKANLTCDDSLCGHNVTCANCKHVFVATPFNPVRSFFKKCATTIRKCFIAVKIGFIAMRMGIIVLAMCVVPVCLCIKIYQGVIWLFSSDTSASTATSKPSESSKPSVSFFTRTVSLKEAFPPHPVDQNTLYEYVSKNCCSIKYYGPQNTYWKISDDERLKIGLVLSDSVCVRRGREMIEIKMNTSNYKKGDYLPDMKICFEGYETIDKYKLRTFKIVSLDKANSITVSSSYTEEDEKEKRRKEEEEKRKREDREKYESNVRAIKFLQEHNPQLLHEINELQWQNRRQYGW